MSPVERPPVRPFEMVAAADARWGIGRDGDLPWRLPGDMAHFVRLTKATEQPGGRNAVIMGRVTWDSIPKRFRPLADRLNVVVSRDAKLELPPGVLLAGSLDDALDRAASARAERIFVIGGASLYRLGLAHPQCRRVHLTRIDAVHDCDTFFPALGDEWAMETQSDEVVEAATTYQFETWTR